MTSPIKFGTDGWRAIIAEDFTFANVRVCAQSVAQYLQETGLADRGLVIGFDTRFASDDFAAAAAEVVAANDIKVWLCSRPAPTPAISYAILEKGAGGAIVITASHNPAIWNGLKYKPDYAGSASPEVVAQLEQGIEAITAQDSRGVKRMSIAEAKNADILDPFDPQPAYFEQLNRLVDIEGLKKAGLKVVVDSMHGAARGWLKTALYGGKTQVWEIRDEMNPAFPDMFNPEPIARNLPPLVTAIREHGADVGLATDGDGDRIGIIDENGVFINQLQVFALIAHYMLEVRGERGPLVKSITTTRMVNRLGELYNVSVYEMPVGFKFIGPKMMEVDALMGGEESGGYGFRGHVPERDGLVSALYFLDLMARTGRKPSELLADLYAKVGQHYYDRADVHLTGDDRSTIMRRINENRPTTLAGLAVTDIDAAEDGFRFHLEGGGWLLIRFSGTEPLLRIYTEVQQESKVQELLTAGKELAGVV